MIYEEAWIDLHGMCQKVSLRTGAMFKISRTPILRCDLVHYERHAGFTVSQAEWAVVGADDEAQRDLLRDKLALAEIRLYENLERSDAHKSANCASNAHDTVPQRATRVGSDAPQSPLRND